MLLSCSQAWSCWHVPYLPVIANGAMLPEQKPRSPRLSASSLAVARSKSRKNKVASLFPLPFNLLAAPLIGRTKSEAIWQGNLGLHIVSRLPASCNSEQRGKKWE